MDWSTLRTEILEVLEDVDEWELTPEAWTEIEEMVTAIAVAWDRRDLDAATRALADLELASPLRMGRLGEIVAEMAPPTAFRLVREDLVHTLNGVPDAPPGAETGAGTVEAAGERREQPPA